MGYKAAMQVLKQAEELKIKLAQKCDWLNDSEAWTNQQKLQTIYHQVLVLELEYALDKKVEQDLWNIGFKNHISSLQEQARDKKNPLRSDCQALLTWALESASGFYLTLLQELCNTFDIDLSFRRRGSVYGQTTQPAEQADLPQTSSCLYVCQYCLVHLGDIARYRNQRRQAESFYKQAILVSPTSGHPYNQLALLEASRGNKLSTVFYYIRGIAVKNPFPASTTNLLSTLSSAIDKDRPSEKIQTKMSVNEFIQLFLCTHGYLHSALELKQAELAVKSLNSIMTALVATQSFTKDTLIKLTIINLYALRHVGSNLEELTADEKKVRELTLELIAGSLCALLVPIHTLKMDEMVLDYYALPAIKFLLFFIQSEPDVLKENVFTNRLQIWPSLVKLLNHVQKYLKALNYNKYLKTPLPEDKSLQGFLLFSKNFKDLDFSEEVDDPKIERMIRMKRIVDISIWLTEININGNKLIIRTNINGETNFEPGCIQPDPTNDLLEEMKSFSIIDQLEIKKNSPEKKTGILKPQGSLEKSREEREMLSSGATGAPASNIANSMTNAGKVDVAKNKRSKQNVALQSIFKKIEENKQVKFTVDDPDADKSVSFDALVPKPPPSAQGQFNMPLRTQSFNQNHPAFPAPPPQPQEYLGLRGAPAVQVDKSGYQQEPSRNYQPFLPSDKLPPPPQGLGMQMMPPYLGKPSGAPLKPQGGYPSPQQGPFSNPPPYQNVSFPPSHPFNTWKRDDVPPLPSQTWWQNTSQPPPPAQPYRQDPNNYPLNFPPYNPPPYLQHPGGQMPPKHEFGKPAAGGNQGGGDVFGSPWGGYQAGGYDTGGFEKGGNQGMSMRQAMLKEANLPGAPVGPPGSAVGRLQNPPPQENKFMQNATTPGYSLFNTNSWTPNLAGQLRNNKQSDNTMHHLPSQSLFSGQGPKSLAQLLEHQQSQLNKNDL